MRPTALIACMLIAAFAFAGCLAPEASPTSTEPSSTFGLIHATSNVTVYGPSVDRETECDEPASPQGVVDVTNRTLLLTPPTTFSSLGVRHVLYEDLQIVDVPQPCPRLAWLMPVLHDPAGIVLTLHGHEYRLNVTRDGERILWDGAEVGRGTSVERPVAFQRNLGGRVYDYVGSIRFTFVGLWPGSAVHEEETPGALPHEVPVSYWHLPTEPNGLQRVE